MNDAPPSRWRAWVWPDWSQRKRVMRKQAWAAVLLAYFGFAFAWVWPLELRNTAPIHVLISWAVFMLWTFCLHIGLLLAVIGLLAWRYGRRWLLAAAAPLAIALLIPLARSYFPIGQPMKRTNELLVMSVNLLVINRRTQPIIDEIVAADPDVLLLQEYTDHWREALDAALGERYPHRVGVPQSDSFGAAIYSKRPFLEKPATSLAMGEFDLPQVRAVIEHAGEPVAIYNVHLLPPRTLAYTTEHRLELADLIEILRAEDLPFIVAGDFNFTSATPHAEAQESAGVLDAWDGAGEGPGATWPVNSFLRYLPVPGLRIDHVYHSDRWMPVRALTGTGMGSDHRPLRVTLALWPAATRPDETSEPIAR